MGPSAVNVVRGERIRAWKTGVARPAVAAASLTAYALRPGPSGAILAAHVYEAESVREAVILAPTVKARELPKANGKVSFELHAGLKVRLLEHAGDFVRIRLPNGLEGWTHRDTLAEL